MIYHWSNLWKFGLVGSLRQEWNYAFAAKLLVAVSIVCDFWCFVLSFILIVCCICYSWYRFATDCYSIFFCGRSKGSKGRSCGCQGRQCLEVQHFHQQTLVAESFGQSTSAVSGQRWISKVICAASAMMLMMWISEKEQVQVVENSGKSFRPELCSWNPPTCSTSSCEHPHKNRRSRQPHVTEAAIKLWDCKAQGQGFNLMRRRVCKKQFATPALVACSIWSGWVVSSSCVAFLPVQTREFSKVSPDWICLICFLLCCLAKVQTWTPSDVNVSCMALGCHYVIHTGCIWLWRLWLAPRLHLRSCVRCIAEA